ncbi:hypothetical protein TVAG_316900 [Trichomonas vaginalis G3]|uniref:Uncharacterized protein n=1 Tax=Trichomonas vaginalis (strain ATCC PRA-98 / G3) TaxID=412133 RepID=A2F067_TRIV3|nr:hypothetical protein TVAGG3_0985600 [Trichomonas vaginalis G3]EAY01702.1 hypothetical protein TVAG_316900 [Trichomonas vaginalis G3]KAI5489637.1 hypothetical protein TVAGG3_0985600 [Trichomonas vaginalis G3]|eukprot:XP_001330398.1 hypothetical protein [Trichomonas vaginalis G3]
MSRQEKIDERYKVEKYADSTHEFNRIAKDLNDAFDEINQCPWGINYQNEIFENLEDLELTLNSIPHPTIESSEMSQLLCLCLFYEDLINNRNDISSEKLLEGAIPPSFKAKVIHMAKYVNALDIEANKLQSLSKLHNSIINLPTDELKQLYYSINKSVALEEAQNTGIEEIKNSFLSLDTDTLMKIVIKLDIRDLSKRLDDLSKTINEY